MNKKKIKSIQFPFRICPIFYTQKRSSDLFIRINLPSKPNQLTSKTNTNMIIKPNCSFCNNNTCICHQRNSIYSLQCNICLKTCNNNINNDIKQGKYIGETSRNLINQSSSVKDGKKKYVVINGKIMERNNGSLRPFNEAPASAPLSSDNVRQAAEAQMQSTSTHP